VKSLDGRAAQPPPFYEEEPLGNHTRGLLLGFSVNLYQPLCGTAGVVGRPGVVVDVLDPVD